MSLCRLPAYGWGEKGHRTAAIVADTYLTEQSREQMRKLLPVGTTLADAARAQQSGLLQQHGRRAIGGYELGSKKPLPLARS
jgi:hypothetical protein